MQDKPLDIGSSFQKLKDSLGSLMFCWCRLEGALADALREGKVEATRRAGRPFNERLVALGAYLDSEFRAEFPVSEDLRTLAVRIDHVRRRRNLIVHGLAGVSADPSKGEPHIICNEGENERRTEVKITQTELTELLENIDRCRLDLEGLAYLGRCPPPDMM